MTEQKKKTSLDILREMADKDLDIDKSRLDYESLRTPKIHNKWLRMLFDRKEKLMSLELKRKIMAKDKWLYYTGKASDEVYKEKGRFELNVLKSDLSMFIDSDTEYHAVQARINRVESEIDFIKRTLEECNRRSFHISNALKALKFMNGEI